MSTFGIEVSGEFLEIPAVVGIAYDIAGNDFAELNTRQGINSNDFNIPATVKNKRLLTGTGRIDASLYLKNRVVSIGYLQVVERDYQKKIIKVAYFGSNSDWLSLIENRNLRDINVSRFDHGYNLNTVVQGLLRTTDYCYPVINYGYFSGLGAVQDMNINLQQIEPAMYASTVLKQVFEDIEIVATGSLFEDDVFKKAILPWTGVGDALPSNTFNTINLSRINRFINTTVGFEPGLLSLATVNLGSEIYFDRSPGYLFNQSAYGSILVSYTFDITVVFLTTSLQIRRVVRLANGDLFSSRVIVNTLVDGNFVGNDNNIDVPVGAYIDLEYDVGNDGVRITYDINFTCQNTKMVMGNTLPDVSQKEFVKWVVASFGCLINFNDKTRTITFNLSNKFYQNLGDSLEWSNRLDMSRSRKENFIELVQDYAQVNNFTYNGTDGGVDNVGAFLVNDNSLPENKDYYTAPFKVTNDANARLGTGISFFIPELSIVDEDGVLSEVEPRVLTSEEYTGINTINFTDDTTTVATTDYFVPEFAPLSYSILIPQFYTDIERIINNKSSFEVYLRLSSSDIEQFNQENIVRIEAVDFIGYFYVSKIEDFNAEDLSYKVTLIKL